jgi:DNA-binding MarR family transcriptional regulator
MPRTRDPALASIRLEAFLPYRLSVLTNTVSRWLSEIYAERFGITVPEWRVLAALGRFAPLAASEVAGCTAMDKVQVSRAIARLSRRTLIARARDAKDKRRSRLELSARGRAMLAELAPLALAREAALLQSLTAAERAALDVALAKLQDRAEGLALETKRAAE